MKMGIVGFAGTGKTTLFNALTGQNAPVGFGSKVNLGTKKVLDRRVERLAEIDNPEKTTYTEIVFADVPGGKGKSTLDSQTLGQIREMDALTQVVRGFDNGEGAPSPLFEISSFESELILSDMAIIEKKIERLKKDHSDKNLLETLLQCQRHLEKELPLRSLDLSNVQKAGLRGFAFLSEKPILYVLSLPEEDAAAPLPEELEELSREKGLVIIPICTSIEAEIASLNYEDQHEFLADLGLEEPASERFVKSAYKMLKLITFFTHGKDECRAWSLGKGSTAVDAAGTIHSDLARGFIRAEIVSFDDFDKYGSEAACREKGVMRVEGKDYIVQDGDICHIRFNV